MISTLCNVGFIGTGAQIREKVLTIPSNVYLFIERVIFGCDYLSVTSTNQHYLYQDEPDGRRVICTIPYDVRGCAPSIQISAQLYSSADLWLVIYDTELAALYNLIITGEFLPK